MEGSQVGYRWIEPRAHAHFNVPEYRQHLLDDARQQVQALIAEESRTWSDIQDVVVLGRPHREILRIAGESPADLIVMGAQGRGGLGLAFVGSTTQQVVRAAQCPVLAVRIPRPGRPRDSSDGSISPDVTFFETSRRDSRRTTAVHNDSGGRTSAHSQWAVSARPGAPPDD